jgi:hypothetical protein
VSAPAQALRFVVGARRFVAAPPTLERARARVADEWNRREQRFLGFLDRAVWSQRTSPYLPLLHHAGVESGDLRALVRAGGLPGALARLRDEGVYVAYEEWLGTRPAIRGSATFHFSPPDFANPLVPGDFLVGTGGTRSGGIPIRWSFASMRRSVDTYLLRAATWNVGGTAAAVWLPSSPSAVGLATVLLLAGTGEPPERWFSPVPRDLRGVAWRSHALNHLLPVVSVAAGVRLPRPRHVSPHSPGPVLRWASGALARHGRARLGAYASSAVALAHAAQRAGISLEGLVIATLGEPLGPRKAQAIRASGAAPANAYGFMQAGTVAVACPRCGDEELHLLENEVEVIRRHRVRADGAAAHALAWTSLAEDSPTVMLNLENDDTAELNRSRSGCDCELGRIGMSTQVSYVRGLSKIAVAGMTIGADTLLRLAESVLPARFGGAPGAYQFVCEESAERSCLELRINSTVGAVDEAAVYEAIASELRRTDAGVLADAMWSASGAVRVVRAEALRTPTGKLFPMARAPLGPTV